MLKRILVTILLAGFCVSVFGQTSKSLFEPQDGGFKIGFPVKPSKKVSTVNTAFGKTPMTVYTAMTAQALYSVTYLDFPTVLTDGAEQNIRFGIFKESILTQFAGKLINETDMNLGDYRGKDFVVEGKNMTGNFRLMFVEQRLFQLSVINAGLMSRMTPKTRTASQKKNDAFFNSFAITKLPKANDEAVELPEDFDLRFENSRLRIGFFGMTANIPEDWTKMTDDETQTVVELGALFSQPKDEKTEQMLNLSLQNTKIVFMAYKEPSAEENVRPVFSIAAEKVSFPTFLPEAAAKAYLKMAFGKDDKVTKQPTLVKIGGKDFYLVESYNASLKRWTRFYIANLKGIAFEIFMFYSKDEDLRQMLTIIDSIKFEPKAEKNVY